jgi:hypothetical protein
VTADLERRYRRLLAWYPREHRKVYHDEMLGVLLDAAAPDQHRPTLAEASSLIVGAMAYRLRRLRIQFSDEQWRRAAGVTAVFTTGILLAVHLRALFGALTMEIITGGTYGDRPPMIGPSDWAPVAGWALVMLAGLVGPRRVITVLAWAAAFVEVAIPCLVYVRFTEFGPPDLWTAYLGIIAAATITAHLSRGPAFSDGLRLLGWRRVVPLTVGGALLAIEPLANEYLWSIPAWGVVRAVPIPITCGALVCGAVLIGVGGPLRRRILALLAPAVLLTALHNISVIAWAHRVVLPAPNFLAPLQWLVLLAVPLAALRLSTTAIRRWERRSRTRRDTTPATHE